MHKHRKWNNWHLANRIKHLGFYVQSNTLKYIHSHTFGNKETLQNWKLKSKWDKWPTMCEMHKKKFPFQSWTKVPCRNAFTLHTIIMDTFAKISYHKNNRHDSLWLTSHSWFQIANPKTTHNLNPYLNELHKGERL